MPIEPLNPAIETTSVKIRLDRALPMDCALCGTPGKHSVTMKFLKSKSGTSRLGSLFKTLLIGTFMGPRGHDIARQTREEDFHEVRIPLCSEHRNFRRGYDARMLFAAVLLVAAALCAILFCVALMSANESPGLNAASLGFLSGTIASLAVSLWVFYGLFKENLIRGKQITGHRMVLEGVAVGFAKAIEERNKRETEHVDSFLDELQ